VPPLDTTITVVMAAGPARKGVGQRKNRHIIPG
jgi:hypothetical protein